MLLILESISKIDYSMPAKTSIGLYFNDNIIEISQISSDGKRLDRFNQLLMPEGIVVNGEIKNEAEFVKLIRQLLATAKPGPIAFDEEVIVGVNDSRVFLREFTIPNIPGQNLNDAIEYQVRSLLPVLPTGVETDWQIIGRSTEGQIEVLLVAIPRNIIDSYVSCCTRAGLRVVGIEPAVFANIRIINPSQLLGRNQLLVYLGDNFGVFTYITGGNPRFSDYLPQSELDKGGDISKTVQAYINFANSKHPNRTVSEIIVSGSREEIDKTVELLRTRNMPVMKAVSRLAGTNVINHSLLHTSHGLSLKTLEEKPSINLLPVEFRLAVVKENVFRSWSTVLNILIVLTVFVGAGLTYIYRNNLLALGQLTGLKDQYDQQLNLPENKLLVSQTNELNRVTGELVILKGVTGGEENLLKVFSAITPNGITLTSFVITRGASSKKLADPGSSWVLTGTANSRPLVLSFYNSLLNNPGFSDGKLYFGSLEKETGLTFRIAGTPSTTTTTK